MISVSPKRYGCCPGGTTDSRLRRITSIFGHRVLGPAWTPDVIPNNEWGGAYCERTGIWFPPSKLATDGMGRTVGAPFKTKEVKDSWLF